jgi:RHS repeat-associated protein
VFGIINYKDTTHGRDQTFTYDALNRLISAQNTGTNCSVTILQNKTEYWGNSYGYDAWGNLLQKNVTKCGAENLSVTADAHNWIHASGTDYQYDAAGNMTYDATASLSYTFDQENRLTGAGGYTYTYDADGNRVRKSNGNLAASGTLYWYMTPGVVAESDLAGTLKSEYVFFDGERVARKDFSGSTASLAYYFSDHLKTASVITDSSGVIKAESDYYPWGGELQFVNNDSNDYKFTGKKRDLETGLDYFGARYYSSGLGRWVSADWSATPIPVPYAHFEDPQSLNLYGYVRNIPTSDIDPDGHGDAWQMKERYEKKMAKLSEAEQNREHIKSLLLVGGAATAAVGGEVATPLARGLFSLFLATAPVTMPIVVDTIEGLVPGRSGTLTVSTATRLTAAEISTGVRLANQTGTALVQSEHIGAEFVDAAGRTYDAMGGGKAFEHFGDGSKFMDSIVNHVNKSVDKVAIDLKGASKEQVGAIKNFVETLTKKQQDKVIYVE